jgi:hypothetical protein
MGSPRQFGCYRPPPARLSIPSILGAASTIDRFKRETPHANRLSHYRELLGTALWVLRIVRPRLCRSQDEERDCYDRDAVADAGTPAGPASALAQGTRCDPRHSGQHGRSGTLAILGSLGSGPHRRTLESAAVLVCQYTNGTRVTTANPCDR